MQQETAGEIMSVLVCISASPSNQRVIRSATRFAQGSRRSITALYVDDGKTGEERAAAIRNLELAESLGASGQIVNGRDVLGAIMDYARDNAVTDLFIGYSGPSQGPYLRHLPVYRLVHNLPEVDIHIIPDSITGLKPSGLESGSKEGLYLKDVLILVTVMGLATALSYLFDRSTFSNSNIITVYILAVLITAALTARRVYGIAAAVLYILLFNFLFIEPRFSFLVYDPNYLVTYLVSIIAAIITGDISSKMKQSSMQSSLKAYQAQILLNASEQLQRAGSSEQIARITADQLEALLGRDIVFYPVRDHRLVPEQCIPEKHVPLSEESDADRKAAAWTLAHNQHAGWGTRHFPEADRQYLSVRTGKEIYGLVGVSSGKGSLDTFEENILLSLIGECALSLEAEKNRKESEAAMIVAENERFRSKLLRSVSHDLRTPLTSISGNAANLMEHGNEFSEEERVDICKDIYDDSIWLIDLVENLLSITKLENNVQIHPTGEVVADVLSTAVERMRRYRSNHIISLEPDDECLMAWMDVSLILQVLYNLIGNALKHTPEGTKIRISDMREGDRVIIRVSDNGPGISDEDMPHIFELFYSGRKSSADSGRSLGLGLSLCRSIVNAHGEELSVERNTDGGVTFYFGLKIWEEKDHEAVSYPDCGR